MSEWPNETTQVLVVGQHDTKHMRDISMLLETTEIWGSWETTPNTGCSLLHVACDEMPKLKALKRF